MKIRAELVEGLADAWCRWPGVAISMRVRCLHALGVDADHGVLRMSFVHYNTEDEVDRLLEALDHLL